MNNGFILIWRKLEETSFYKDSHTVHLALHLLMKANHKPKKFIFNNQEIELKRGECICGRDSLSFETGINPSKIYRKLIVLKKVGFLDIKTNNKFSIISISSYNTYQSVKLKTNSKTNNKRTTNEQQMNTNNTLNTLNTLNKKEDIYVSEFFNYFLLKTKKAFKLTSYARSLIHKRFKEGFTLVQLKQAVDNFVLDDWPERHKHLDLIYCIGKQNGKPDNLEKWLNYKPKTGIEKYIKED